MYFSTRVRRNQSQLFILLPGTQKKFRTPKQKIKMKKILLSACVLACMYANAQNTFPASGSAGIGTTSPNASALLEMVSTTKGLLITRMTKNQRDAIAAPATGLMIYQTNNNPGFYYYSGSNWEAVTPKAKGWSLTGNSGTSAGTNFIGTTDAQPLLFKVGNIKSGSIEAYFSLGANTGFGYATLSSNVNGISNAAFGASALASNVSGSGNTAIGLSALSNNISGSLNTAVGASSLNVNTTGEKNTALGTSALLSNTTGSENTASGYEALTYNITGINNTATGYQALYSTNSSNENTAIGYQSLYTNSSGNKNAAIGSKSLYNNTTGSYNAAVGAEALYANTTGEFNTANGFYALNKNTTGDRNTSTGSYSMYNNTTGRFNTAMGVDALNANTVGSANAATGFEALRRNTTGYSNVAMGAGALFNNTTGNNSVAIGDSSLFSSTAPGNIYFANTAVGSKALYSNSNGFGNQAIGAYALGGNTTGALNTAIGFRSLRYNNGQENTAIGVDALYNNTTGYDNVALGNGALENNYGGYGNTGVGYSTLTSNQSGMENTAIGYNADVNSFNLSNATAVGASALATASNQVMLGNTAVTSVKAAGSFVIYSDGRFKKNIKENVPGLNFINQLKPVTYNYDIHKLNEYMQPQENAANDKNGLQKRPMTANNESEKIKEDAMIAKEKKTYTGFVAQDVEKIADKMGYDFSGVYKPQNDKDPYGISYADFVVPLVKAVQELSKENEDQKKVNNDLQNQINELRELLSAPVGKQNNTGNSSLHISLAPNPVSSVSTLLINGNTGSVAVTISDLNGKQLWQSQHITAAQIKLPIQNLAAGMYMVTVTDGANKQIVKLIKK